MLRGVMPALHPPPATPRRSSRAARARLLAVAAGWGCGGAPLADPGVLSILPGAADPCVPNALFVRHLDEPTALGFSAVEVLERLAGPRLSPVDWLEPEPNDEYVLEYGPERGSGGLELDVRLRDGPLVLRQPSPRFDAPEDTTCPPGSLQIPVEVTLRSSGLSLDEAFDTAVDLVSTRPKVAFKL